MTTHNLKPEDYPSVGLAYDISLHSYGLSMKRAETIDEGIDKLRTWITTITLGVITLIFPRMQGISFWDYRLMIALVFFLGVIVLGVIAKSLKALVVISPQDLYNGWLHYSEWEFKKNLVYWAGKHFESNLGFINKKAQYLTASFILSSLEVVFLLLWVGSFVH